MKRKKWIIRVGALAFLCFSMLMIRNVLMYKSPHGMNQTEAFYHQKKNTIDVLAVGSSHVHCDINTGELWDSYGIAAYDFSAAEQPFWITYYYLEEAYKYQSPKVVVLDVFSAARFKEDFHYKWAEESIYSLRFSKTKWDMLQVSIEPEYRKDYFPSFLTYHNRYIDLNKEDLYNLFGNHKEKSISKGFTPGFIVADQSKPFTAWEELEDYHLTEKSEVYLRKIIEMTKAHDSQLVLIVAPYNLDPRDRITYEEIERIAAEEEIPFYDFTDDLDAIGIDRALDFNDHTHLNYFGSVKFSNYLGQTLKDTMEIPDRRGDSKYKSYEEHVKKLLEEASKK